MDNKDVEYSRRSGSLLTEIAIIAVAVLLGYMFYDGLITVNQTLHFVGLR